MNKQIWFVLAFVVQVMSLRAQDYLILNPYQLAISTSTARVANSKFSGSGLAQAFYRDNYYSNLSLYLPYNQLTDADMRTSAFEIISPAWSMGSIAVNYGNFNAENFNRPVFNIHTFGLGYSNALFNRLIFSFRQKWNSYSWYSNNYKEFSEAGYGLDINMIYIPDGYSSIGMSVTNLVSSQYSSTENDRPASKIKLSYFRSLKKSMANFECGLSLIKDTFFKTNIGGFVNSELQLSHQFSMAAEYKHQWYNEIGLAFTYTYSLNTLQAQISYGLRLDDSPLPISTFRHAFGLSLQLNKLQTEKYQVNPQLIYRDEKGPEIHLNRISDYTLFTLDDATDILELKVSLSDELSGLKSISMEITPETDSTNVIYRISRNISGLSYSDTLFFNGYGTDSQFVKNQVYTVRIKSTDHAGNQTSSYFLPFRVLSKRNDSQGPEIKAVFDTSSVKLESSQPDYVLKIRMTIDDKSESNVHWRIQMFKSTDDSVWTGLKPVTGSAPVYNHDFQWLLRRRPGYTLNGNYKVKVDAFDELNNHSQYWSPQKNIVDNYIYPAPGDTSQEKENQRKKEAEPTIVYIPAVDETSSGNKESEEIRNRFLLQALYKYKKREVNLTEFKFVAGQHINISANQQSLSIIGFYLQDLPGAQLMIEYPEKLKQVPGFEKDISDFFERAFGIDTHRVHFNISGGTTLKFEIK